MSQRKSGYARRENDLYETPEWVTEALLPHLPHRMHIWEPAAGSGKIARVLRLAGHFVEETDRERDFMAATFSTCEAIITNPPYGKAKEFIEQALKMHTRIVAMLLRVDFDSAKTRRHLFADHPAFAKKLVLTRRIVWFEPAKAAPSFNHAWFIWDRINGGWPALAYDIQRGAAA